MTFEQRVLEAVARGWCHPANAKKEMDSDLAKAISEEVLKMLTSTPEPVVDWDREDKLTQGWLNEGH